MGKGLPPPPRRHTHARTRADLCTFQRPVTSQGIQRCQQCPKTAPPPFAPHLLTDSDFIGEAPAHPSACRLVQWYEWWRLGGKGPGSNPTMTSIPPDCAGSMPNCPLPRPLTSLTTPPPPPQSVPRCPCRFGYPPPRAPVWDILPRATQAVAQVSEWECRGVMRPTVPKGLSRHGRPGGGVLITTMSTLILFVPGPRARVRFVGGGAGAGHG